MNIYYKSVKRVLYLSIFLICLFTQIDRISAEPVPGGGNISNELPVNVTRPSISIDNCSAVGRYLGPSASCTMTITAKEVDGKYIPSSFQIDGSGGAASSRTVTFTWQNYQHRIFIQYGTKSTYMALITYKPDTWGPTLSPASNMTQNQSGNGLTSYMWRYKDDKMHAKNTSVSYSYRCSDSNTGCKKASGKATAGSGATTATSGAVYDNVGNASYYTVSVKRDTTPPYACGYNINTNNNTWAKSKTITSYCTSDNFACGGGQSKSVTGNGTYTMYCYDSSSNARAVSVPVQKIDRTAPSCGTVTYPANHWYRSSFNIKVACSDGQSGCTRGSYTETKSAASGSVTIKDKVGWTKSCPYSGVKIDKTAPTVKIEYGTGYGKMTSQLHASDAKIPVVITGSDGQAGVQKVCYRMSGATSKGNTCIGGSTATVYVSNEGNTTVTAWAYDKAYDYNTTTGTISQNGNKSSEKSKVVYVDRTAPTISFSSSYDGKWTNQPPTVAITMKDSGAGIGKYYYYWSTSSSADYDKSTALFRTSAGNEVGIDLSSSYTTAVTRNETNPSNSAHNDIIYLHVKACDRAFSVPNCRTAVYSKAIKFDNIAPRITGFEPSSREWVNKLQVQIGTSEYIQTGKQNSGIDTIRTYWDTNAKHVEAGKTKDNSSYSSNVTLSNANGSSAYRSRYDWTIDFANRQNVLKGGGTSSIGASEEGTRFIRATVTDIAGNTSQPYVSGPYKWDTSEPKITGELRITGNERTFQPASNYE